MNLRDKLVTFNGIGERIEIIATDDTFVADRKNDEHILRSANVDVEQVCKVAMKLKNK